MSSRIALIHATSVAIDPIAEAFRRHWPDAETMNLLDDSLSRDRARTGRLDGAMFQRFQTLADYAVGTGADGILFTCSAFGPAITRVQDTLGVPVLKPNQAMFDAALGTGRRIAMLVTFGPSVAPLRDEFEETARARDADVELRPVLVEQAMAALADGDGATHNRLLAEAAAGIGGCDAIMLAQFSMARAADSVAAAVDVPVLTAPDCAVLAIRAAVAAPEAASAA